MVNEINLTPIYDFIIKVLILFGRPSILIQLGAIASAILLAWWLSKGVEFLVRRWQWLPFWKSSHKTRLGFFKYLNWPLWTLVTLTIARQLLLSQDKLVGLVDNVFYLFVVLLIYRFSLALLYATFSQASVRRYHYRLFAPLFILFILTDFLASLTDLNPLANVILAEIFENAITIGTLFQAVVGLYLWIGILWGAQEIILKLIARQKLGQLGALEASLTLGRYVLIGFGTIVVLSHLGFNPTTVAAITGGLSIGVGVGLKEILGNFISGILLLFEGVLKPGDIVKVEGEIAIVKRLGIRATTVQTFDNIEKIVPNQQFLISSVTTYTGSDRLIRLLIPVGVSYKSNPKEVHDILFNLAQQHPRVLPAPEPIVWLVGFGDSSIDFELAVWIDEPLLFKNVKSDLHHTIWEAFAEHNIEIPFPQRDLHIQQDSFPVKTTEKN